MGLKRIGSAFRNKMHSLETEIKGLRLSIEESQAGLEKLQKKNAALEGELVESHQRAQRLNEENRELDKTVKSLDAQVTRLDRLKQAVLVSIQDDRTMELKQHAEMGGSQFALTDEYFQSTTPLTSAEMGLAPPKPARSVDRGLTLTSAGAPPASNSYVPSAAPAPAVSPAPGPTGSPPAVDGKQFFRQARSRLSYESFNLFLASIKRLNNQQQSREVTLEEARSIFGAEHQDLFRDYELLLNRHGV